MEWLNEPASWQRTGDVLTVSVDPGTDFWRETGYGYIRDSGHVYGEVLAGDLDVSVRLRCTLEAQYDQAGVMLRADERDLAEDRHGVLRGPGPAEHRADARPVQLDGDRPAGGHGRDRAAGVPPRATRWRSATWSGWPRRSWLPWCSCRRTARCSPG